MKKLIPICLALSPLLLSLQAHAYYYRYPRGHGHYYRPYYSTPYYYYPYYSYYTPWYSTSCYYGGYGCQYYLESTDTQFQQREDLYLQAREDAARYLQEGGEPSTILREALQIERDIAQKSGLSEATHFDERTLAEIILSRTDRMLASEDESHPQR